MIPPDTEFDVYVTEGALVEVWRGKHLSVAQQFGSDWDGQVHSFVHSEVFTIPQVADTHVYPCASAERMPWHSNPRVAVLLAAIGLAVCVAGFVCR